MSTHHPDTQPIITSMASSTPPMGEYTLPGEYKSTFRIFLTPTTNTGVMKYLQREWQRNEKDRIQWELERAEMKVSCGEKEGLLADTSGGMERESLS